MTLNDLFLCLQILLARKLNVSVYKTHILGAGWKTAPVVILQHLRSVSKQNGPCEVHYKHFSLSKSSKPVATESQADRYGACMLLTHVCVQVLIGTELSSK